MFCNLHHAYAVNWLSSQLKISALVCGNEMACDRDRDGEEEQMRANGVRMSDALKTTGDEEGGGRAVAWHWR